MQKGRSVPSCVRRKQPSEPKYDEESFLAGILGEKVQMGVRGYDDELAGILIGWDKYHIFIQRESERMMVYKHTLIYLRREQA